jgi:UDP-N-acetylglucosamine:LPS N-acetylglucosamine transferase
MIFFGSLPGQESRNERFATAVGVALLAKSRAELREAIFRPFDDPSVLRSLRENIRRVRRPLASDLVVESLLGKPARLREAAS